MLIKFRKTNKLDSSPEQSSQSVPIEDKAESPLTVKRLVEARRLMKAVPDVREKKVARIRKRLDNGTYKIDGERIASKMIKECLANEEL
jgi:flagellar biosynthesis anti-sigma factor FlgM